MLFCAVAPPSCPGPRQETQFELGNMRIDACWRRVFEGWGVSWLEGGLKRAHLDVCECGVLAAELSRPLVPANGNSTIA